MAVTSAKPWVCPTCHCEVATPFCPACGERPLAPRDLTLGGMLAQLFHAFTNVDGRLIQSFRCLFNRPGALTVAYVNGRRAWYIGPFQLFLLANVLFFAVQSVTGINIVGVTMDSHLNGQDWSSLAQELVAETPRCIADDDGRLRVGFQSGDRAQCQNAYHPDDCAIRAVAAPTFYGDAKTVRHAPDVLAALSTISAAALLRVARRRRRPRVARRRRGCNPRASTTFCQASTSLRRRSIYTSQPAQFMARAAVYESCRSAHVDRRCRRNFARLSFSAFSDYFV